MYHVLVALDSNVERMEQAIESVTNLPGREDLSVTLLNVFEEFEAVDEGGQVDSASLYDESDIPEAVETAHEHLKTEGITTSVRREHGDPAQRILQVAKEINADAILMAGRKRSPAGKVLFGSVTQSILLSADRPVIVTTVE